MGRTVYSRGLTLIELVIATALFGLSALMIGLLVRQGASYLNRMEIRAELQRSCLFGLSRVTKELNQSSKESVRLGPPGEGVVFASPQGLDGVVTYSELNLQWKSWICVYRDPDTNTLVQAQEEFLAPTLFKPDPSSTGRNRDIPSFFPPLPAYRKVLARNVSKFHAEGFDEITLELEAEVGEGDHLARLTTRTVARPRN